MENQDELLSSKKYDYAYFVGLREGFDALLFELYLSNNIKRVCAKVTINPKNRLFTNIKIGKTKAGKNLYIQIDKWYSESEIIIRYSKKYNSINPAYISLCLNKYIRILNRYHFSYSKNFQQSLNLIDQYRKQYENINRIYTCNTSTLNDTHSISEFLNCYKNLICNLNRPIGKLIEQKNKKVKKNYINNNSRTVSFIDYILKKNSSNTTLFTPFIDFSPQYACKIILLWQEKNCSLQKEILPDIQKSKMPNSKNKKETKSKKESTLQQLKEELALSSQSSHSTTISPEEAFQRSHAVTYRDTNGIFYTLKKEQHALNAAKLSIVYAKYTKKFAFIGRTEQTRKVFDLLVVDIDLAMEKIHFTCIKNRKAQHLHMNIEVDIDHFTFHFLYEPSGVVALFAKVTAAVCNRMYNRTESKQTNGAFSSVQHITTPKQTKGGIQVATTKKEQKLAVLKWNNQPAKQSSQHSVYCGYKMSPTPKEKKSYIRRAHWQSYWYGARNSPDRCKRLRWVEATIVNRDAAENILITL